jgi:hypothetical protein
MNPHETWLLKKVSNIATYIKLYKSLVSITRYLFYFMLTFGILLLMTKFTPLTFKPLLPFVITLAFLLVVTALTLSKRFSIMDCAKYIDKKLNLKERISTAIETICLKKDTQFARLLSKQASECLKTANIPNLKKIKLPIETILLPVMAIFFVVFAIIPKPYIPTQPKFQTVFKPQITGIDIAIQGTTSLPQNLSNFIQTELEEIKKMLAKNPQTARIRLEKLITSIKKQIVTDTSLTDAHKTTLKHLLSELESTGASLASKLKEMGMLSPDYMRISKNIVDEFTFTDLPPAQLPHPATRPSKIDVKKIDTGALRQIPEIVKKEIKKAFVKHNWHPKYDPVLQRYYKFLQEE